MRVHTSYYDNALGAVQINDIIMHPLLVQLEVAPENNTGGEIVFVDDYGNVTRWWCNGDKSGEVQL